MKIVFILLITFTFFFSSGFGIWSSEGVQVRIEGTSETIFKGEVALPNNCSIDSNNSGEEQIEGPMAICALNQAANVGGFGLDFQDYSIGLFLKKIAGMGGDWRYWVNKQYGPVGLDSFPMKSGDSLVLSVDNPVFPEEKTSNPPSKQEIKETKMDNKTASTQIKETETQNPVITKEKKEEIETISAPIEQEVKKPKEPKKIVTKSENTPQFPSQEKTLQAININTVPTRTETKPTSNPSPSPQPSPSQSPSQESKASSGSPPVQVSKEQTIEIVSNQEYTSHHSHEVETSHQTLVKAPPQQSSLPQTGPEMFLLGFGGASLVGGSFLRLLTRREDPFARILKPVKRNKKWSYH